MTAILAAIWGWLVPRALAHWQALAVALIVAFNVAWVLLTPTHARVEVLALFAFGLAAGCWAGRASGAWWRSPSS